MNQVEVKLDEVSVKFNDSKKEAYKLNFNIITYQKTFESNVSSTKKATTVVAATGAGTTEQSGSCVSWSYDIKKQPLHLGEALTVPLNPLKEVQSTPHAIDQSN